MEAELKAWGNSLGIIIPKEVLNELDLRKGDKVEMDLIPKKRIDGFGIAHGARPFEDHDRDHHAF